MELVTEIRLNTGEIFPGSKIHCLVAATCLKWFQHEMLYLFFNFRRRSDTILAGSSSMLFVRGKGEHSITTRDLSVSDITVVQFDVCTSLSLHFNC